LKITEPSQQENAETKTRHLTKGFAKGILPAWLIEHPVESFSYKKRSVQTILPACENQFPPH